MNTYEQRMRDLIARMAAAYHVDQGDEAGTPSEKMELLEWLRQSPLHVSEYLGVLSARSSIVAAAKQSEIPLEQLIAEARADTNVVAFQSAAGAPELPTHPHIPPPRQYPSGRLLAAASLLAGLAVFLIAEHPRHGGATNAVNNEFTTAHGEQRIWELSDNTVVHLNSDTKISVKFEQHSRSINLAYGQAYFEVAKDPARPFHVLVGNVTLQDIGTSFDVFRTDKQVVVTVVEGHVAISMRPAPSSAVTALAQTGADGGNGTATSPSATTIADLRAGQQATIQASGNVRTSPAADVGLATAWMRQEIIFERESVQQVAAEFNRYNQIQIEISDPRIARYRISGLFHTYDVDSFVEFLRGLRHVHVTRSENTIKIGPGPSHLPQRL